MKYLLDTNTIINFLRNKKRVVSRIKNILPENLYISSISYAEIQEGLNREVKNSNRYKMTKSFIEDLKFLNFGKKEAVIFGGLRYKLRKQGKTIDDMDTLIASVAIEHDMVLVTSNIKHFQRVKGLMIEDWMKQNI